MQREVITYSPIPPISPPRINLIREMIRLRRPPHTNCLFCNSQHHTIDVCNCNELRIFLNYNYNLKYNFIISLINNYTTLNVILDDFKDIVGNWTESQVRSYCSKVIRLSSRHLISTDDCKLLIVDHFRLSAERILNNPYRTNDVIERHLGIIYDDNVLLFNTYQVPLMIQPLPIGPIPTPTSHIRFIQNPHSALCYKECPVCYDNITPTQQITFNCSHIMCGPCVGQLVKHSPTNDIICPLCRTCISIMKYNTIECLYNITTTHDANTHQNI